MAFSETTQTQPKKWRRNLWSLAAVIALACGWRVVSSMRAARSPFSDKDKVLVSIPWRLPAGADGDREEYNYTWQDNETILYGLRDEKQKYHLMRQRVRSGQPSAAEPLPNIPPLSFLVNLEASPDGKWLLTECNGQSNDYEHSVYALDTGAMKQKYLTPNFFVTWMQDSRSFLCYVVTNGYVEQNWKDEHRTKILPLTFQLGSFGTVSPLGENFLSQYQSGSPSSPKLERGSIFTGKSQVHTIPRHGLVLDSTLCLVSPQGDRLLWYQKWSERSWFANLWGKLTHRYGNVNNHEAWYLTDANGNNLRELVTLHTHGEDTSYTAETSLIPQWLPDGKHLSMVYKGALYVVEVP